MGAMMQQMMEMEFRSRYQPGAKSIQFLPGNNIDFGFVGGNKFGRYDKISSEESINMIVSDDAMVAFPGYEQVIQLGAVTGRGIFTSPKYNHMIVVSDNQVYICDDKLNATLIGKLDTTSGPVYIAENLGDQIAISDEVNIYVFNYLTNRFQKVIVNFQPKYIAYQDTYFICADGLSNKFRLSDNNNGLSWPDDASHVGELQTKATTCTAAVPLDRQLFVFGKTVSEPWQDVGYRLFPYQRTNYFSIDYGAVNPATIASGFGILVWLGSNERTGVSIMYTTGGQGKRLSNDGIDFVLSKMTNPNNSVGFLFREAGHIFYVITFITDNVSYAFDFNTGEFFTLVDKDMNHHIARQVTFFNGNYYFVSLIDGNVYKLSSQIYTLDGHEMPRFRILKSLRIPSGDMFVVRNINITLEQGILENENKENLSNLPKRIPRIDLSVSKDAGEHYWSVAPHKMNTFGRRPNVCNFWNVGAFNDCTLKFAFWGNQRWCINQAFGSIYQ
ncbi:MAG: hypothetical protein ACTHME_05005 [Candidatus Nitrosocosmicus sp.]